MVAQINQHIPEFVHPTLQYYLSLVEQQVPGLMQAFYLEGSIALGEFNEQFSDIDFVVVLEHPITPVEIKSLRNIHKTIERVHSRWKMSGSYLQTEQLLSPGKKDEPVFRFHDGVLRQEANFDINSVEGWILKHHGIAVLGPDPQDLPFTVDWAVLVNGMQDNLNSYWASWTKRPNYMFMLLSDWGIQWAVLGVLRQFYSFRERSITTKIKSGEYALASVPTRWHPIIQEAIRIREGNKASLYRFRAGRAAEARAFLKFIISSCNTDFT